MAPSGFAAWLAGSLWVAGWLLSGVLSRVHHDASRHLALALAAVVLGVVGLAVGAVLAHRRPWLCFAAVVAAAPARIPMHVGGTSANLLVPLYAVIAAGALATGWDLVAGRRPAAPVGPGGDGACGLPGLVGSIRWRGAPNRHQGGVEMLFFYLPFGFLIARLGQLRDRPGGLRRVFYVQLALAAAFAVVAFWQEATRHLFWNPKIRSANDYKSFFRVNSLFWDASIYGRFMAVTIVLLAGLGIHRKLTPALAAGMAGLFVAMYLAYSQSSLLALAVGVVALGSALWPRRVTIGLAVAATVAGLATLVIALHGNSANRVTSDRLHLIRLGERVIEHHPLRRRRPGRIRPGRAGRHRAPLPADRGGVAHHAGDRDRRAGASGPGAVRPGAGHRDRVRTAPGRRSRTAADAGGGVRGTDHQLALLQCLLRGPVHLDLHGPDRPRHLPTHTRSGAARVIEAGRRALVLAPHTDDGEFGCGGTIARLVEAGAEVHYMAFSTASRSLPAGFPADTLVREVRAATAALGIPPERLTVHDFEVRTFPTVRQEILELLVAANVELAPDLVLMPSLGDIHQDHETSPARACGRSSARRCWATRSPGTASASTSRRTSPWSPGTWTRRCTALSCYASQQHRNYANEEYIRNLARTHGIESGRELAEVFEVYRWVL